MPAGKAISYSLLFVAYCLSLPSLASASPSIDIVDFNNDAISLNEESYMISVWNFAPGENRGGIYFNLYTNLAPTRANEVADLFITESYYGNDYLWAMPLVNHNGFTAGSLYAVGAYQSANDFGAGLDTDIPVRITSLGSNYGHTGAQGGKVFWQPGEWFPGTESDWLINTAIIMYEDDPNGNMSLTWGTTIYGADIVSGSLIPESAAPVPEPASIILLGTGAISLLFGKRRKK